MTIANFINLHFLPQVTALQNYVSYLIMASAGDLSNGSKMAYAKINKSSLSDPVFHMNATQLVFEPVQVVYRCVFVYKG